MDLRTQVGIARATQAEALKRRGLHSAEYQSALAAYVALDAQLRSQSRPVAAVPSHSQRCPRYTHANGCPLHGELCAPEYR